MGLTPARLFRSGLCALAFAFSASSASAQENWANLSLGELPALAVPTPSAPVSAADPCAHLPLALAAADSSPYDSRTIACFDSLTAVPDYVSPAQPAPAPALTKDEKAALTAYVDVYAYLVNAALREGKDVSKYRKYIKTLNSALAKMPVYGGVTFRGSAYPPLPVEKLVPGAVFTDPAFLSTSRNLVVAQGYTGANGYLSVILGRTGRSVSYNQHISDLGTEMEVLFRTNTRMRVIAVGHNPAGGKTVYLEELP